MKSLAFQSIEKYDAWRTHLRDVVEALGIPFGTVSEHVVASVAVYCREHHPHGLGHDDLKLLLARSFCAVGDQPSAEQVLRSMWPHRLHVERWLEILSELHNFPTLLPYFSIGFIRPADWSGARLDRMWILDFNRLTLDDSERHEIMLYRSMRTIMEHMVLFWDATAGSGVLGLKGLDAVDVAAHAKRGRTSFREHAEQYIRDLLDQQAAIRGWKQSPELLNMDI